MARGAAWGVGKALGGREAARIATERALDQMGTARPVAAIILAAQEFDLGEAIHSVLPLLPNVPLWGFSTIGVLADNGEQPHSVIVMILSGTKLTSQVFAFSEKTAQKEALENLRQILETQNPTGALLVADGYQMLPRAIPDLLENHSIPVCGGLASGARVKGKTFQVGGDQVLQGGLSALVLGGRFRMGSGVGSGWISIGKTYPVTRATALWLDELDGKAPAEIYAEAFGCPARDWSFPPLNELVRLYPLGVQTSEDDETLTIHAPLWVEVDGRFRVNIAMEEGRTAHLMVGDRQACLRAAEQAARDALSRLGKAQPIAALVFVDAAWQMLFEEQVESFMSVVHGALPDVPLVGAYTFGQTTKSNTEKSITLHNQHIEVIVLGTISQ